MSFLATHSTRLIAPSIVFGSALLVVLCGCQEKVEPVVPFVFRDVTQEAGIQKDASTYSVAAADFDKDGFPDLAVSNHHLLPFSFLKNQTDGTFDEIQPIFRGPVNQRKVSSGSDDEKEQLLDIHGMAAWYFDDDDYLDLFLSTGGARANRVLRNMGDGRFEQVDIDPLLAGFKERARSIVPMIVEGGGDAFCFLNHTPGPGSRFVVRQGDQLEDKTVESGFDRLKGTQLMGFHGDESGRHLYLNYSGCPLTACELTSAGRFVDVSKELGLKRVGAVNSIALGDYDNDGDQDIYLCRGPNGAVAGCFVFGKSIAANLTLKDKQGLRFRTQGQIEIKVFVQTRETKGKNPAPEIVRLGRAKEMISVLPYRLDVNDQRLEGEPDILQPMLFLHRNTSGDLILQCGSEQPTTAQVYVIVHCSSPVEIQETWGFKVGAKKFANRLLENREGEFVEVTEQAGVGDAGLGQDSLFADFDNDGDLDLYVINGGLFQGNSPNVFYRNNGNGTFAEATQQAGLSGPEKGRGDAAVAFDFDRDGDLDIFSINGHGPWKNIFDWIDDPWETRDSVNDSESFGPYCLWENETAGGKSFSIDLIGSASGRLALGTRVVATFGGKTLIRERNASNGASTTSILPLHFGLGDSQTAELAIYWASGKLTKHSAKAGEHLEISEP